MNKFLMYLLENKWVISNLKSYSYTYGLLFLLIIGGLLRFYNLNWDAPFYFHPDERNIASVISESDSLFSVIFKSTFSYGNLPIIAISALKHFIQFLGLPIDNPFAFSTILLRVWSASWSVGTLIMIYKIGKIWSSKVALTATILSVFSVGFIQHAHYGTVESFVTFWITVSFFCLIKLSRTNKKMILFLSIISLSIASAAKINMLSFYLLHKLVIFIFLPITLKRKIVLFISTSAILIFFTLLLSPYYTTENFFSMLLYERGVVSGSVPVFYTSPFYGSLPVLYQFEKIFPFLINPILTILFLPSMIYVGIVAVKHKNKKYILILLAFLITFIPQTVLFTKWSRYLIPCLPFLYIILALFIVRASKFIHNSSKSLAYTFYISIMATSILFGYSYLHTVLLSPDSRIAASVWAQENISNDSSIVSEVYDPGIMPFQVQFPSITFFDTYTIDQQENSGKFYEVLHNNDYVILPSQRILSSRIQNASQFPNGNKFYTHILDPHHYSLIYTTPCDIFCTILYLGDPIYRFEETSLVFDRPTVQIFERIQ